MDAPAPIPAPAGTRCLRCGYDVGGISAAQPCPECGLPVRDSLVPSVLELLPPSRVTGYYWGAGLLILIGISALIVSIITLLLNVQYAYSITTRGTYGPGYEWLMDVYYGLRQVAGEFHVFDWLIAFLLAPPVALPHPGRNRPLRRIFLLCLLGLYLLAEVLVYGRGSGNTYAVASVIRVVTWLIMLLPIYYWCMRIGLAARWRAAQWFGPLAMIALVLTTAWYYLISWNWSSRTGPGTEPLIGTVIVMLLQVPQIVLAFGVWRALRPILQRRDTAAAPASAAP